MFLAFPVHVAVCCGRCVASARMPLPEGTCGLSSDPEVRVPTLSLLQDGAASWLSLKADYEILGRLRACGTPGCLFPDWHNGPHSHEQATRQLEPNAKATIRMRRSPRFCVKQFPWEALGLDLQALVLLQLAREESDLLHALACLARVIRPWRHVVLHAIHLHPHINDLLSSPISAVDSKFGIQSSALRGFFLGAHHPEAAHESMDECMRVQLRLLRPRETPRSWKWELDFRLSIPARGSSTEVTVGSLRVYYIMSERLGLLRNGGRPRPHRFCEQQGYVFAAGQEQMRACGICKYKRDTLIHPKLITMRQNALILSSTAGDLFTWELPKEAVAVLRMARSFV
jgi:hypothetical protein